MNQIQPNNDGGQSDQNTHTGSPARIKKTPQDADAGKTESNKQVSCTNEDSPLPLLSRLWIWIKRDTRSTDWLIVLLTAAIALTSYLQWKEISSQAELMKGQLRLAIETASPSVWEYHLSLVSQVEDCKGDIAQRHEVGLLDTSISAKVCVEFENFGPRAALIKRRDIEWIVAPTLPDTPVYPSEHRYEAAIRPSGTPPQPEAVVDEYRPVTLTADQVHEIVSKKSNLWIYGKIDVDLLSNQKQTIRFCGGWSGKSMFYKRCPEKYIERDQNPD